MRQNTGPFDRTVRIMGGLLLAFLGILRLLQRRRGLLLSLLGLGFLVEGLAGYCIGYDLLEFQPKTKIGQNREPVLGPQAQSRIKTGLKLTASAATSLYSVPSHSPVRAEAWASPWRCP